VGFEDAHDPVGAGLAQQLPKAIPADRRAAPIRSASTLAPRKNQFLTDF